GMKNILHVSDPNVYARSVGAPELHPLVGVIHYDEVLPVRTSLNRYGVYGLFIQRNFPRNLTYGMKMFDAADGSIFAVEPGQIGGKEDDGEDLHISGWVLMFSPELIRGTDLESRMKEYRFFSYFAVETLKMEPSEWARITQLLTQLRHELRENEDSPGPSERYTGIYTPHPGILPAHLSTPALKGRQSFVGHPETLSQPAAGILFRRKADGNGSAYRPILRVAACLFTPVSG
ncbi:MAG: hypothetical protein IJ799_05065, partial [Bacteroidales bacterium]|nr:hypothetical protein [Bacteroidales bacterium]